MIHRLIDIWQTFNLRYSYIFFLSKKRNSGLNQALDLQKWKQKSYKDVEYKNQREKNITRCTKSPKLTFLLAKGNGLERGGVTKSKRKRFFAREPKWWHELLSMMIVGDVVWSSLPPVFWKALSISIKAIRIQKIAFKLIKKVTDFGEKRSNKKNKFPFLQKKIYI